MTKDLCYEALYSTDPISGKIHRTHVVFSPERSDHRRDSRDDVEVVHQVAHVLSKVLRLTVVLTSGCRATETRTGDAVVPGANATKGQAR